VGAIANVAFESLGEGGLILRWPGDRPSPALTDTVRRAWQRIAAMETPAILDVVPAPGSLLVRFDPLLLARDKLVSSVRDALEGRGPIVPTEPPSAGGAHKRIIPRSEPRKHVLGVFYGWRDGPDLRELADRLGLTPQDVVGRHCAGTYTIVSTGFAPGFIYLGGLHESLHLERRAEPRRTVPPGSVAIGGSQTGIYGLRSPGGWWLIGRTSVHTFDVTRQPPSDFVLGDEVRFVADPGGVTGEVRQPGGVLRRRPWVEGA